jgi:hypothetical protein
MATGDAFLLDTAKKRRQLCKGQVRHGRLAAMKTNDADWAGGGR